MPSSHQHLPLDAARRRRRRLRLPGVTLSTLALVAAPTAVSGLSWSSGASPGHDRAGSVREVALSGLDPRGVQEPGAVRRAAAPTSGTTAARSLAADTSPTTTAVTPAMDVPGEVAVVGASWPSSGHLGRGGQVQVRTRTAGHWGAWQVLDADTAHGPDTTGPDAAEGRQARAGTEPFVVTDADAVQVRVDGGAPAPSTKVEVVDPGERAADPTVGATRPDAAAAATSRPTIYSRAAWGADESLRKGDPSYGSVQAAFVHHTVSTNNYSAAEVPAIIRGIYRFHVEGRGWNDIGYNFLVDRFGRIWEGRYGGVDQPVIGAHTQGYNSQAFAMSAIGNFDVAHPPSALVAAYSRLFAWKLSLHGTPATGWVTLNGKRLQRISGHRDAGQTACPGRYLYAKLGTIRSATASRLGSYPRVGVGRSLDGGGSPDLIATPSSPAAPLVLPESVSAIGRYGRIGTGFDSLRSLTVGPDVTGDGLPDLVAMDGAGRLRIYRGDGHGGFAGYSARGSGWGSMSWVLSPGDLDGDGRNDLLGVTSDGRMRLYPGDGHGWVRASRVIGTGWQRLAWVSAAGDLDGNGVPDLVGVRPSDGRLLRYLGTGTGTVGSPAVIGTGWAGFTRVIGAADLDGDGHPDLLARERSGRMRTYYGVPGARYSPRLTWGRGFGGLSVLAAGVDWNGDGHPDLLGQRSNGDLLLYQGTGRREYDRASTSGLDLTGTDAAFVIGDLNRDGKSSVIAREQSTGDLYLYPEPGTGTQSTTRRRIGTGWSGYSLLAPAGDMNRDGVPDLLARQNSTGTLYLYPMHADASFGRRQVLATGWGSVTDVVGVGTWDSDGAPDLIARLSDGTLRLYPGNGPGRLLPSRLLASTTPNAVSLVGAGDVDGDGRPDLIARGQDGRLGSFSSSGGGLGGRRVLVTDPLVDGAPLG